MNPQRIEFDRIDDYGPQSYEATFDLTVPDLERAEVAAIGPVRIEAHASKGDRDREYMVDGKVEFTADFLCSRCVDPYPIANSSSFHVTFHPRPAGAEENEEIEITDSEELDVEFYSDRSVSLQDLAIEQVQLSIPMKPLCEEGCLGLCPSCGSNRNRRACACGETATDARWGALEEFREQLARKKDV